MAANDEEQLHSLLTYYRSKIGEFDRERLEWMTRLEEVRLSYEDRHELQWELGKRREELTEVGSSLTEAKVMLFEER
jgi:coiled-coil domain-containing protein 77